MVCFTGNNFRACVGPRLSKALCIIQRILRFRLNLIPTSITHSSWILTKEKSVNVSIKLHLLPNLCFQCQRKPESPQMIQDNSVSLSTPQLTPKTCFNLRAIQSYFSVKTDNNKFTCKMLLGLNWNFVQKTTFWYIIEFSWEYMKDLNRGLSRTFELSNVLMPTTRISRA